MTDPRIHTFTYTIVLDRDPNGDGYVATCPTLPGLVTEGETIEETLDMARDAVRGYLEGLQKDGLPIPEERDPRCLSYFGSTSIDMNVGLPATSGTLSKR